ncbi:MAG: LppP/LprE family lipoprotein [Solirubrobacteraceae bacterium]
MKQGLAFGVALLLGTSCGALLGGCGSQTKTVSVAGAPSIPETTGTTTGAESTTTITKAPTRTTPAQTTTSGGTPAPTSTRTAPAPAFTKEESGAEGLSAAMALVRAKGFTPNESSQYHSSQTLRVLVGTRTGSSDGYGQQAFFFVNGRYIGTDSAQPSATLKVIAQSDTEVELAYPLYRKSDPLCCPGGGQAIVRFQLNNGKLVPLGPIPPASSSSGLSRE